MSDTPDHEGRDVEEGPPWVSVPKETRKLPGGQWPWLLLLASAAVLVALGVVAYAVLTYTYPDEVPRPRGEGPAQLILALAGLVPIAVMVRSAAKSKTRFHGAATGNALRVDPADGAGGTLSGLSGPVPANTLRVRTRAWARGASNAGPSSLPTRQSPLAWTRALAFRTNSAVMAPSLTRAVTAPDRATVSTG